MSLASVQQQQQNAPLHICITGSSQGIGLMAAKTLIANGHTVYHACRTTERAQEAVRASGGGVPMVCNLADLDSVRHFAHDLQHKASTLDVLCLNAGMAPSAKATKPTLTKNGLEECIGVNHLGHFLLANLLHNKLKSNGGGRLVVTASSVHDPESKGGKSNNCGATLGDLSGLGVNLSIDPNGSTMVDGAFQFNGNKAYKDSKLCNLLFCQEAKNRFSSSQISVRAFNPGLIPTTALFDTLRKENWWKAQAMTTVAGVLGFSVPVEVGGERLVYIATASDKEVPNGSYFSAKPGSQGITRENGFGPETISKEASDPGLAVRLWDRSMEVVAKWMDR